MICKYKKIYLKIRQDVVNASLQDATGNYFKFLEKGKGTM